MKRSLRVQMLAVTLAVMLAATGCSANWINVALQDLPILTQMAVQITSLVTVFGGANASPVDVATINGISKQASDDLALIQVAYNQYKASPNATALQKIQDAIATTNQNLPALLAAAHVSNAALSAKVAAAVQLILATVTTFSALIPSATGKATVAHVRVPKPKELRAAWQLQVGVPLQ